MKCILKILLQRASLSRQYYTHVGRLLLRFILCFYLPYFFCHLCTWLPFPAEPQLRLSLTCHLALLFFFSSPNRGDTSGGVLFPEWAKLCRVTHWKPFWPRLSLFAVRVSVCSPEETALDKTNKLNCHGCNEDAKCCSVEFKTLFYNVTSYGTVAEYFLKSDSLVTLNGNFFFFLQIFKSILLGLSSIVSVTLNPRPWSKFPFETNSCQMSQREQQRRTILCLSVPEAQNTHRLLRLSLSVLAELLFATSALFLSLWWQISTLMLPLQGEHTHTRTHTHTHTHVGPHIHVIRQSTVGTKSIETPLHLSLLVSLQPFAKIQKVHFISHECSLGTPSWQKNTEM